MNENDQKLLRKIREMNKKLYRDYELGGLGETDRLEGTED